MRERYKMRKKNRGSWAAAAVCLLAAALICAPLLMIPGGSLIPGAELKQILSPILGEEKGFAVWHLLPFYPTLEHFYRLLIESPAFYRLFWNTVGMTAAILVGQLIVGLPSAWAFAAFRFRGRDILFGLYVVLMLLPFQVMLLPQYIVLQKLHLYNHCAAVILPAIFSTFPVFIMYRGFTQIDGEILEAARLDGAGELQVFLRIGLPLGKMGIQAAMVLSFLEYWNLVEQPMAFLEEQAKWPLSLSAADCCQSGGLRLCGVGGDADSGAVCLCAGTGRAGRGDCLYRSKSVKIRGRMEKRGWR